MQKMSEALVAGTLDHIRELERYQADPGEQVSGGNQGSGGNRKQRRAEAALQRRSEKHQQKRGTVGV